MYRLTVTSGVRDTGMPSDLLDRNNIRHYAASIYLMLFYSLAVYFFTVAWIQNIKENEGLDKALFTYILIKRRDDLHGGRRVGVDDA